MKILVTGGAGFIGRYVTSKLIERCHQVLIYDIAEPKFNGAIFTYGSMLDTNKLRTCVHQADAVMHLAGILGTSETIDSPIMPAKINVMGSLTLFEFCRQFKKRACYICVGNHFMFNTYAISKTCAERFALMYNREHRTKIAVVRGLNAYGPWQKYRPVRKVIPNFVIPALRNHPIIIYGDGEQVMDFIYVEDLAEILCRALLDEHGCYDKIIEAGSGQKTTINFIAEKVISLAASRSSIQHKPMRPGEIPNSQVVADTGTMEPLGITGDDMTTLETGLKKTVDFYRKHLDEYR